MESLHPLKGICDMLPSMHEYFTYIKKVVRHRCRQAGFRRISTPVLERKELFLRAMTEHEPLLKKLYQFHDPDANEIVLKPEGMSGIMRAFIEHHMTEWAQPVELYFLEPLFRYEPTEKHHQCQFHQFGAMIMGENDSALLAQLIQLVYKIIRDLGLEPLFHLHINNIGCEKCQPRFIEDLQGFYTGKERSLCQNCCKYLSSQTMRLLTCNEEDCKILAELAPQMAKYICEECHSYHKELLEYLGALSIPFISNPHLMGYLSYFDRSVFSFISTDGADFVCSGGCMDNLATRLGYDQTIPAMGFSMGIERLITTMKHEKIRVPSKDDLQVFVAQLGKEAKKHCLPLIDMLREEGVKTVGALGKGSMREQIDIATKFGVPYMIIMGLTEVREGTVIIRDMRRGQQRIIPVKDAVNEIMILLGEKNLDKYSPDEILY